MVDFGLAKKFFVAKNFPRIPKATKGLTGTAHYPSINNHNCIEKSQRDDMESLAYVLLYFLMGILPWQGVSYDENHENICYKKMATSIKSL